MSTPAPIAVAAPPTDSNVVNVEVNGVPHKARKGQMIIEVTDLADIYVPRFCYHPKLSIAANCRMCLVEVEKAPKPLPACATPVTEGMKIFTRSKRAISAQKATMEFLLINHPLDCPICDQGGECELQDLAMGFGRGVSRYTEKKRIVKDKNLGALISTDMTRCIHCTRCVRFGQEIAGIQELGTTGRSEYMEIGTYIEKSVDHELSGNIIDLCPVGALNNKPYRYTARAWEMVAKPLVSPHDCAGSNLFGHVLRGKLCRVVPRDNEAINESWLSDRDRFSCHALYAGDRLLTPRVKHGLNWVEVGWQDALGAAVGALKKATEEGGASGLGSLVSPSATLEELYLLQRITRHLGSDNIDYRLRQRDFRDQAGDPRVPLLGCSIADLDTRQGIFIVGSNLRMEVPIIAHRVRKAARKGASVAFLNPAVYEYHFEATHVTASPDAFVANLAAVLAAAASAASVAVPAHLSRAIEGVTVTDAHKTAAAALARKPGLVLLGHIAQRHPQYADLRALAAGLAAITGATLGYLSEGANAAGAVLAGATPHRGVGGHGVARVGFDARAMLETVRNAYILFGIEPCKDLADGSAALTALRKASVVAFTAFVSAELLDVADVLLPIATFAETAGTYINVEGRWQSFDAAADVPGDARPGWRVLRVLGNELELPGCEYRSLSEISAELERELGAARELQPGDTEYKGSFAAQARGASVAAGALDVPIYAIDALVRRAEALQETVLGRQGAA